MEPNHVGSQTQGGTEGRSGNRGEVAIWVIAAAVVIWIVFLISMIVLKRTDIGTPSSAQSALIAANERLLQMVQWTIGTVLSLGGALIGLSWYQSEKRHEHDRQVFEARLRSEMDRRFEDHKRNLDMVTRVTLLSMDAHAARAVREAVGPRDETADDLGFVDRVVSFFPTARTGTLRRGVAQVLIEEIARAGNIPPGKVGRLESGQLQLMRQIADELQSEASDKAVELAIAIHAYEVWNPTAPPGTAATE